jgi:hypothetical protein
MNSLYILENADSWMIKSEISGEMENVDISYDSSWHTVEVFTPCSLQNASTKIDSMIL